ncbi:aminotransferase class V-fold PLP-dependent enzyme [Aurantimonas sp. C2-6-R+9]|uniref:L-aspartate--glyoxylate aminotransferase BhcA n=1 Tax=unclassified Aurantimonas TaxID=2638230 RepID=UPI002E185463|nr:MULTISPECIES: L-aspartate--glyoxylate aminotransferase BhcA [unclassified Aurantimonas]MEC5290969.1 aminotransferase class V-fold PLP-dependent enzyme [Aurantimonas sp. C2-3-R2]MEC5381276.1 aminotransferase class V-fold PLP-dependent enzyme [Aurantimonas sp. C2-6-R+9]MEC5412098.1 aminotransferase class V-fold PLP-dependent enzyme [Aurantimonas sp. C2-4-R8]
MTGQNPVFIPGPTNIPDRLRFALSGQTEDHRSPDFVGILAPVLSDLKKVFKTNSGTIITFPASGTGGWEAAVTNTLSPGDKVLAARHGMFSHRWIDLCQRHGLDVEIIECEWGQGAPADLIGQRLAADKAQAIKAVLVTHNETTTGVVSDVGAVRRAMDGAGHLAMLYVDAVSSLASMDFRMDEWGVDLAVSGSQKGFMLPTGMAIVGVSKKAMDAVASAKCPRCFFDFRDMAGANAKGGFPYTPPVQLIQGLRKSLDMLLEEGLDNVFARHARIAEGVRRAVNAWGLRLCAQAPHLYSDTVTAVLVPAGFNSDTLTNHAYDAYDVSFGVGLGQMAGKAFRIGHLGSLTEVMALSGLATLEMAMKDLDYPITLGSGVAAAQEYYRSTKSAALSKAA